MFVCLGFGHFILFVYFFPRQTKLVREAPLPTPLRGCRSANGGASIL